MVNVGAKLETARIARAEACVVLGRTMAAGLRKAGGDCIIETARIAGIMAAKRTAELIPMCHPLALSSVDITARWIAGGRLRLVSEVACNGRTGVEMEALTAVSVAALTVYDMCKSAGKGIVVERIRLLEKSGGKSGHWKARD